YLGEILAVDAGAAGDLGGELGDAVLVVAEIGVALGQRANQDVAALAPRGGAPGVLLGVHGLVGLAHGLGRVARVARDDSRAERRRDGEAVAGLRERTGRRLLHRRLVRRARDDAELVAAGAVGVPTERGDSVGERGAEAHEERVAGLVAERVVVVLEAVEVEQGEYRGIARARVPHAPLEVGEELAAVAEAGQPVGRRLALELPARRTQRRAA